MGVLFYWCSGLRRTGEPELNVRACELQHRAVGLAAGQTALLFGLLLWKEHFMDQHVQRGCGADGGVRSVRGSPGPTAGTRSPQCQHVQAVKSPRPSFSVLHMLSVGPSCQVPHLQPL